MNGIGRVMNIKQVRYVCAIVDLGSFSAAAAREGVSVQAVSKAMAELESTLGEPLFERRSAGVTPTPLGRTFASHARRVLEEWASLERFVAAPQAERIGFSTFHIGFCCLNYPGIERLVHLISTVTGKVLGRRVEVELLDCSEALGALRSHRADAVISVSPLSADDVNCGSIGTLSSSVLLATTHPLARKSRVSLADLNDYPLLYPTSFEHYCKSVVDAYRAKGLSSPVLEASPETMSADFITSQNVFSFIVAGNVTGAMEGFVIRPIEAVDMQPVPICISTLRGPGALDIVSFRKALSHLSLFG